MFQMPVQRIAIVGAGIIGISTGLYLKQHIPGVEITIFGDKLSPNTTGDGAAGIWSPYEFGKNSEESMIKWSGKTFRYLFNLTQQSDGSDAGVYFQSVYMLSPNENITVPFFHHILLSFRPATSQELGVFPGAKSGHHYVTIRSEGDRIIRYLSNKYLAAGGKIIQRLIKSFDEVSDFDFVVNCSGLGSRELCTDNDVHPIRGQLVRVKAPWLKYCVFFNECYIIPSIDSVFLGGTHQKDDWNMNINEQDKHKIITGCTKVFPSLKNAVFVNDFVGLRPGRSSVRLEKEYAINKESGRKYPIIHNYGHGGSGLTFFWGCAEDVTNLILAEMNNFAKL